MFTLIFIFILLFVSPLPSYLGRNMDIHRTFKLLGFQCRSRMQKKECRSNLKEKSGGLESWRAGVNHSLSHPGNCFSHATACQESSCHLCIQNSSYITRLISADREASQRTNFWWSGSIEFLRNPWRAN